VKLDIEFHPSPASRERQALFVRPVTIRREAEQRQSGAVLGDRLRLQRELRDHVLEDVGHLLAVFHLDDVVRRHQRQTRAWDERPIRQGQDAQIEVDGHAHLAMG